MRLALILLGACSFEARPSQAPDGGAVLPDAGPCTATSATCASDTVLRTCEGAMAPVVETTCAWGCVPEGTAHCGTLLPAGGAITGADVKPGLSPLVIDAPTTLHTDTGEIEGVREAGEGNTGGIEFELRGSHAILRADTVSITAQLQLEGTRAVVIVAPGAIAIDAVIDGRGDPVCDDEGRKPGPGGSLGGEREALGAGIGGGAATTTDRNGGGGGGHGAMGGDGGAGQLGGVPFGDDRIATLVGGSGGGGGGGGSNAGKGGGGGAAIQLVSNTSIAITAAGGINAGGCGGDAGTGGNDAGGGGGAGGTILLEAPVIEIAGALAVNGGGGATHNAPGGHATLDRVPAGGGLAPVPADGNGGAGGAGATLAGTTAVDGTFGGGGGAVGRMLFRTRTGTAAVTGVLSPGLDDAPTTVHLEPAAVE